MSVHVSSWAWKQRVGDYGTKLVLIKLADNADDEGRSHWSQKKLAAECEMGRATVQRKLDKLVGLGLLEVEQQLRIDGSQTSNRYRLRHPQPQSEAPPASLARHHEPSLEPKETKSPSSKRDPIWDALTATLFVPHTKREQVRIGQAARELRAAVRSEFGDLNGELDRVCGEEIVRRMAAYPPDWRERTPEALVKHWTRLGEGGAGSERARHDDLKRRMKAHDTGGAT